MEELLLAFLSKTLNIDKKQVAELVKTEDGKEVKKDALDLLLGKHSEHIEKIKTSVDTKEFFNNGYAKAKQEVLNEQESKIAKHYGITKDLKGLDLVEAIVEEKTKALEKKEITPDEIKKSTVYQDVFTQLKKEKDDEIASITTKFQNEIAGYKRSETFKTIFSKADEVIDKLKPVFSTNPTIALNQRKTIYKALEANNFDVKEDGRVVPLTSDGKLKENEHGHPVSFDSIVTDITSNLFDLQAAEDRRSPGGGADDDKKPPVWNGTVPKDDNEYMKMIAEAKSIEEKKEITAAYEKANS